MSIPIKHCSGCRDNYYNYGSNSITGRCWSATTGKMEWRIPVGMQEPPPYKNRKAKRVPSCWHGSGPYRTIFVKKEALTADGYWAH